MIHGLDTGFLVAAEVAEHPKHADVRTTLAGLLSAGDVIAMPRKSWQSSSKS
jgi:predicted nucleic acid-binding protein